MSFRLAAYAVCLKDGRVLLARHVSSAGESTWTLPGGGVDVGEDPFDTVVREVAEETGCVGVVERLLGVDSRVIPAAQARRGVQHQNVGVFYAVRLVDGSPRPVAGDEVVEVAWMSAAEVVDLRRSSLVDVGLALARTKPATGHVDPVPVGGLVQH